MTRPTIVWLTTADTEILAAAEAARHLPDAFPALRARNPANVDDVAAFLDEVLDGAVAVVVRLLGGRRAWPDGFDRLRRRCAAAGIPLLAFGGEDAVDAEMAAVSTAPPGVVAEAFEYLRRGGVDNSAHLLRFVADTLLLEGFGFDPPADVAMHGRYGDRPRDPARPTVGIVFYRAHLLAGNTAFVDALADAVEAAGGNAAAVFTYSLRPDGDGRVPALDLLGDVDALLLTVLAMGSSAPGGEAWDAPALAALDVPVVQALCATTDRLRWETSAAGLGPLDVAMQVAIPEFDGRIVTVPVSFKETFPAGGDVDAPLVRYVADPGRAARAAGVAVRLARLGRTPNADKRVAVVLSSYPTRAGRVGNAVGLDTPASAVVLLEALCDAGYHVEAAFADGDALIHALIAAGTYDEDWLTDRQLHTAAGRVDVAAYTQWFARLPADLRAAVEEHWGPPPGELYLTPDRAALAVAGLHLGNVFVAIQPPRGFGERPVAIYHDPDLPPPHHYLAVYWWLEHVFRADAVVHLGKHGTLEWLPGKGLGLSAGCAPDAALGDLPLFYPFVVNDPGEGTQAKRRAHATIVDHLVPPMMRAGSYDDLARLEQLLDEHAQVEALDPAKLPALRTRIWELLTRAEIHRDLGIDKMPDDFGDLVLEVDGWLCEVKDLQVRDGLHVLGHPPTGEQLRGLVKAVLRLPHARAAPLRAAAARALGHPGDDLPRNDLDRVQDVVDRLVAEADRKGWDPEAAGAVTADVLGRPAPEVVDVLQFACREVVPRLRATTEEVGALLAGLDGRFVPPGPSGAPTRGRLDVLPTGRNFYSVDPRAIPSRLAWEVGGRLAADLVARYVAEQGHPPASVGIVVWGTANMRTHGDDIAEVLALLGVRPTWDEQTARVDGLEVVPLEELGRPRIDVTVRISGFFRDAFPHLVDLVDRAVELVAGLDEADEDNYVAAHARADAAAHGDWRRATTRIFGSKPGAYGAGLLPLIDAGNWRDDRDLAEVYGVWGGYAYGRGLDGVEARADMETNFARMRVAVKNCDNREHDIFDSDDYFQYHGGMVAAVRALTGADPAAYIGDSADPARPRTLSLAEETSRVFRARVANPRWIASMRRHGYKGAFELAATVDYLFGYDATAGVVADWMYEKLAEAYVLDPTTRQFVEESNPWALQAMAARLLEAAERGLWEQPRDATLAALRAAYLDVDTALEERG